MSAKRRFERFARPLRSAVLAVARVGVVWVGCASGAAWSATHTVVIQALKYEPEAITVERGDRIVWVNKDPFPHTVTSPGRFDSHSIAAGKSWTYVARAAGKYGYSCSFHGNMKGKLTVSDDRTP